MTTIQGANPWLKPRALRVGQRLVIPMSGRMVPSAARSTPVETAAAPTVGATGSVVTTSHRVRAGETASQISRRYGVGLRALLDYNGLDMDSVIRPGQRLRIPPLARARKNQSE